MCAELACLPPSDEGNFTQSVNQSVSQSVLSPKSEFLNARCAALSVVREWQTPQVTPGHPRNPTPPLHHSAHPTNPTRQINWHILTHILIQSPQQLRCYKWIDSLHTLTHTPMTSPGGVRVPMSPLSSPTAPPTQREAPCSHSNAADHIRKPPHQL
ncbi:hypothetical protein E2C01_053328 [Portunus trituberculatus]|uniref:Uncharacterized protein n=1 Tax=Portunus trituberculatus TaxID=210409 RepID=A0A5B7GGS9_PORTR|nr:hypothetical protein [Portunus trituberculatus]